LFMPPCGSHLTPLATGSLERSLLVFSTPRGLTGNDLSRLFFTCTNTSHAATCTCNTQPRVSPHNVVNHSSHKKATIHQSSNHTWSSLVCLLKLVIASNDSLWATLDISLISYYHSSLCLKDGGMSPIFLKSYSFEVDACTP
jgi:hypothetical protein